MAPPPGQTQKGRWEPSRPLKRNILALALTPAGCLLVVALAVQFWGPHRSAAFFLTLLLALALAAAVALPSAIGLHRQLERLERQRDAFYQELMRLSKAASLGEVASSIAHDMNNPLAIMREEAGWIQDLVEGRDSGSSPSREEITNSLRQIDIQIERAREIVLRLFHWARETSPSTDRTDVNLLLNKTLYLLENDLDSANVRVVKAFSPGLPLVACGLAELRQVFLNLMKNAVDAMRAQGGTLTLGTRVEGAEVVVRIGDTGPGMTASEVGRIFEPFYTTKAAGEGTGLGLPISLWIVERLGGRIEVETGEGAGATFSVALPAIEPGSPKP